MKKTSFYIWMIIGLFFISSCIVWAKKITTGEITSGEYPTVAVTNHTPQTFRNDQEYWDSLQKVELSVGGQEQFKDLPKLGMRQPYTGFIQLGDKPQKFGVIVDIVGDEKRLYIDTDGNGSFANKPWYPLLNEWYGLDIYTVECPEPITINVAYDSMNNQTFPIAIEVRGLLNKPGPFFEEKPFLHISVRTWFLVKLTVDGVEKLGAIVDRNNNGRYDDPGDAFYLDANDDGYFSDDEMVTRKTGITIGSKKETLPVNWGAYPDKIIIGEKPN